MSDTEKLRELLSLARDTGDIDLEIQVMERLKTAKNDQPGFGVNLVRQINEGLLLGFGDEIEAAFQAATSALGGQDLSEAYGQQLESIRSQRQQFKQENPVTSFTAELAGGLGSFGAGGVKLASQIPQASAAVKAAATAAPAGAIAGAGAADPEEDLSFKESMTERLGGSIKGAAAAAVFGSLTPKASEVIGDIGSGAAQKTREAFRGAETKALRKISEAIERDGMSITGLMRRKAVLGPDATLSDIGDSNLSDLLETIAQQPGTARNKVQKGLLSRLQGQRQRLKNVIKDKVHPRAENLEEARQAIQKELKEQARPIYERALESPISITDNIQRVLETPLVKPMLRKAITTAKSDTDLPDFLKAGLDIDNPNIVLLDYVKKAMDDKIQKTLGSNTARILTSSKKKLVSELDEQVPLYQDARRVWADGASQLEALELGQDIFKEAKKGAGNIKSLFDEMSASEKEMFKLGASNEMFRIMDNVSDTLEGRPAAALISKIFSTPAQKEAIKTIIDDPQSFRQFQRSLNAERTFINNSNKALSNSATARRLAQQADAQLDVSNAADLAQGRIGGIMNIITRLGKGSELNEQARRELANRLTSADAKDIKATLIQANRKGSLLPSGVEKALKLDELKFVKWMRNNPDKLINALSKATGITAAIEVQ